MSTRVSTDKTRPRRAAVAAIAFVFFVAASWPEPAQAAAIDGVLDVRLRLEASCNFATGDTGAALLDFGRTSASLPRSGDGATDSASSIAMVNITCSSSGTGVNAPVLTVDYGLHARGTQRYLSSAGGERVAYDLYADVARHVPLTLSQPVQIAVPRSGVTTAIPVYGDIARVGNLSAGLYTDVVWLTLSY